MADGEDDSLAHVGHAIYALLEQIATFKTTFPINDQALRTLKLILNESDRFAIWSSSTGLLIPGHGSLDYRVREAESLSRTFRTFLTDLRENFEEVLTLGLQDAPVIQTEDGAAERDSEGDNDSDDGDILDILLETIKGIIDHLFRLATKLRSPETRLRSSRAQNFQILDDGVDLFKCFFEFEIDFVSSVFRHCRKGPKLANDAEHTASPDGNSKAHVDDDSSSYLIERIALANVVRRRQFAYWKHHRLKLEKHTEAAIFARKVPEPTKVVSILPATVNLAPATTISTATQLLNPSRQFDDLATMTSVSEYMPSSAGEYGSVVVFPPPPQTVAGSKFFECPYCFTTCAKNTLKVKAWQAHLIHDLRPYICTYEGCKTPNQLYDTKVDWILHETTSHATIWKCPIHPNEVFDGLVAFQLHAADGHIQNARAEGSSQDALLAESSNKPGRLCPVCTVSDLPAAQLNDHIATHLEKFAIFSLPKHASAAKADDDDQSSDKANGEEDSRGLDMESDLSFASAPISMRDEDHLTDNGSSLTGVKPRVEDNQPATLNEGLPPEPGLEDQVHRSSPVSEEGSSSLQQQLAPGSRDSREAESDAEQMYLRDIATKENQFGLQHTSTVDAINNLGLLYFSRGQLESAEQMYRRALAGYETALGPEHTSTLSTVNNLGLLYFNQGKLEEAEQMYTRALAGYETALGPTSSSTLSTAHKLGLLYFNQGKLKEAEQMYTRALAGYETALGLEHPSTLSTVNDLGLLYQGQGRLQEAEQLHARVLATCMNALGQEHPDTLSTMHDLAETYRQQYRWGEAEQLEAQVLETSKTKLGADHPATLISMNNLARIWKELGRSTEAILLMEDCAQRRTRVLGVEHPDTLFSHKASSTWEAEFSETITEVATVEDVT